MSLADQPARQGGKRLQRSDQQIGQQDTSKKPLNHSSRRKSSPKLFSPLRRILHFHLVAGRFELKKVINLIKSYLTAVQCHAHAVATKRGNHACCIAHQQHVVIQFRFPFKAHLRNGYRRIVQYLCVTKNLP